MSIFDDLLVEAEGRAQTVVAMQRDQEADVDDMSDRRAAFAFVLGTDDGDAMIVMATISGDGKELTATIETHSKGVPVEASVMQMGHSVLVTSTIDS